MSLLDVKDLRVRLDTARGPADALPMPMCLSGFVLGNGADFTRWSVLRL